MGGPRPRHSVNAVRGFSRPRRGWGAALTFKEESLATTKTRLEKLREPFPADKVKQRDGGRGMKLDYVPIETTLERLLDVAPEYNWSANVIGPLTIEGGKWTAAIQGVMEIDGKRCAGFGAMTNADPDMALKSANSEAMKNAAKNGWGISLELWDAEHREGLARQRRLQGGDLSAMKAEVFEIAKQALGLDRPTAAQVAQHFGVKPGDLADEATLRKILEL